MDLLQLFTAIADGGTIAGAARQLNMSPSVATRKIAALEKALQARLFDRTTRRIHLTEAGVTALEWARSVVEGHLRLADELSAQQGELSGLLRLVVNEYLGTAVLPEFLADFSRRYPQIRYTMALTDALVEADARDYDIALHSGRVPDSGLKGIRIRSVRRVLCASPAYLKRRGTPNDLESLANHDCLVHRQHAGGHWMFRLNGKTISQPIRQLLVANSYLPLMELARAGMGIIRVSELAVRPDLARGSLVQILPAYESVYADGEVAAVWVLYPDDRMLARVRVFLDELSKWLKQRS